MVLRSLAIYGAILPGRQVDASAIINLYFVSNDESGLHRRRREPLLSNIRERLVSNKKASETVKPTGKPGEPLEPEGSAKTHAEREGSTEPGTALLL